MKILMVNFLRLGDIFMTIPLVNAVRKKYPSAEVHYLSFAEFSSAHQVMKQVDVWHGLSRSEIQQASSDGSEGFLTATDFLDSKIIEMSDNEFDLVMNLSHTTFSSLFCGLVEGKEKLGVFFEGESLRFSHPDFEKINSPKERTARHYLDWFLDGFEFSEEADWSCGEPDVLLSGGRRLYLFQTISSDEKKAWSEEKWRELFAAIRRRDPLAEMKMICSSEERALLENLSWTSGVEIMSGTLENSFRLIRQAYCFITLDTSTKHLANSGDTKVIELAFGSSDFRRQGAYKRGAVILAPHIGCYPCETREICSLTRRSCAREVSPSDVLKALDLMEGKVVDGFSCRAFQISTHKRWGFLPIYPLREVVSEVGREVVKDR